MKHEIDKISEQLQELKKHLPSIKDMKVFLETKTMHLGKKSHLTNLLKQIGGLSPKLRNEFGKEINSLKKSFEELFRDHEKSLQTGSTTSADIELGLLGNASTLGHAHLLAQVRNRILAYFNQLGFITLNGFELETDYYNFQALNMPEGHPARATQDSFYISPTMVLRTQTSPMQIRAMEVQKPPLAVISPGKVFRRDTLDATHSYCFHQIEGLLLDENIGFNDLKGVLSQFCHEFFGKDLKIRFRPDYFPFTEPSCEISIEYPNKKDGWLEILGAGMVNPLVLKNVGIDHEQYGGFAFGMGIERIAMLLHGINDIRLFYENDYRFLEQF